MRNLALLLAMEAGMEKRYLHTREAADHLGLAPSTLEKARCRGDGPPFLRPPDRRRVMYDRVALDQWMAQGARTSTADPGPEAA